MTSTVGVIFTSINDEQLPELTKVRSKGSIPYGGRYRLVDFVLSNMVNSGITTVGMLTKNNYQSLMDHLGSGKEWDLARKEGGLILLPPYSDESEILYKNRLEALKGATAFLKKAKEDFVVLADSDAVYKLDYSKVVEAHVAHNADITMVYHEHECSDGTSYMMFDTDKDGKITSVDINAKGKGVRKHYVNVFVARTTYLLGLLQTAIARGLTSFSKDIILPEIKTGKIYGYKLDGYYSNINSLPAFYRANMDLLNKDIRNAIFGDRDVYTKVNDAPPAKITATAKVSNSLIHDGCLIEGTVENCILFRNVKVGEGTHLKNCIIMSENVIGEDCNLQYVVTDKDCTVGNGVTLAGCEQQPYFINKGSRI
ncbi:MAG: glucose-1-phosphate adenylyltransferase subunit GlgD [Clostridia bacterium]|nr:glucose-1-phosphate adenylyltransferase subunit GlgD [Clostridia bacterium]